MSKETRIHWPALVVGSALVLPLLAILLSGLFHNPNEMDSVLEGKEAPSFSLPRLSDDQLISLSDLRGQPLVVNFWATWCQTCPIEHPLLVQAARYYEGQVQFLGIAYEDKKARLRNWLQQHGGQSYPTLIDVNGKTAIAYGVYGVPETYFIDAQGKIVYKHVGPLNVPTLKTQVERLLRGGT